MRIRLLAFVATAIALSPVGGASGSQLDLAYRADQSSFRIAQPAANAQLPRRLEEFEPPAPRPALRPEPLPAAEGPKPASPILVLNVWDRVRSGFALPEYENRLVSHWQAWYLNRPQLLKALFERSRRYIYHVVEQIDKRGICLLYTSPSPRD